MTLDDIVAALDRALAAYPQSVSLLFDRAKLFAALGRDIDAEPAYHAVLAADAEHFRALNDLGLLYHRNGFVREAEACFRAAVDADPSSAIAATNLASVLLERRDLLAAQRAFERALRVRPDHLPALRGLRDTLERLELDTSHVSQLDTTPPPPPTTGDDEGADPFVELIYDIGANAIVRHDLDAATLFLDSVLDGDPRALPVLRRVAAFASMQHDERAALRVLERAAALAPDDHELLVAIAAAHEELGEDAAAAAAWSSDRLRGTVRIFAYTGGGTPVRLLTIASALHAIRYDLVIDRAQILNTVLYTQAYEDAQLLPPHDVVLVGVADVESDRRALEVARRIVARTTAPVLNHPDDVARTSRAEQTARLTAIAGVRTARIAPVTRARVLAPDGPRAVAELGFTFPVLLRSPGFHNGQFFEKIERGEELAARAAAMPTEELLLLSYEDTRGADGMFRKLRMMTIDGALYPVHLAVSPNWKVHYASSSMRDVAAYRDEEAAFLADPAAFVGPTAMTALAQIAEAMHLDYGGIDFALDAQGQLVVFEANGAMGIFAPDADPRWDYRRPAVARARAAVVAMIVRRASASH